MSGERVGFRFKHADAVVKRNPQGRSRRGWVMEPVEQTTSRGIKMPAYKIRWRDSERLTVLQHINNCGSRSFSSSKFSKFRCIVPKSLINNFIFLVQSYSFFILFCFSSCRLSCNFSLCLLQ